MSFWGLSSLLPSSVRGKRTNQDDADLLKRKSRRRTANSGEHDDDDDSASHGGPLPVNLANPLHTPLSTDARWDLAINPTSAEFAAVHRAFWLLLRDPGQTVQGIVEQHFTAFERDLLWVRRGGQGGKGKGISGGGRNDDGEDVEVQQAIGSVARAPRGLDGETALAGLRAVNGWRYIELMQTKKFQEALKAENAANAANGEEGDGNKGGDVALRLAMAWFGLPVAALNGPEEEDEPANGGTQRTGLEFLAEYVDRTYAGRDFTDSKRDLDRQIRQLQRRYGEGEHGASQGPVALRGGSVSVGPSSPRDDPEVLNKADQMSVLSKENRRHYKTKQPPTSKRNKRDDDQAQRSVALIYGKNPEQPTRKDTKTPALSYRWVPLYGYQGKVHFRSDLARTFVDAVDRLLCLDNRVGVAYTVYLFDRRKPYASDPQLRVEFMRNPTKNGITIWAAGPGDYSHDTLAWKFIRENVLDTPDDDEDSACKVLFVAGPDDPIPWIWEPQLEHRVLRVMAKSLDPPVEERPDDARDVAYLRVPRDEDGWLLFTNQYAPWVANLCRVLTPGRVILRPGRPAVPDAWFTMDECTVGMYGGLVCPFAMWVEWAGQWSPSGPNEVELLVMAAPENATGVSDRWHLFMAGATGGYEDNYILHDEVESAARSHDRIVKLVEESISSVACERLDSIEVYLPGQRIALQGAGGDAPVLSMGLSRATSSVYAFRQVYQHLITWKRWLESQPSAGLPKQHNGLGEYPLFIGLYPVYSEYTVIDRERTQEPVRWNPKTSTVAEFRDIARGLIGLPPREEIEDDGSDEADRLRNPWITVTQGRNEDPIMDDELDLGPLDVVPDFHKPILVLGPHTGEAEWKAMCKMIVEPEVQVSEIVRESHPLLLYGNPTIEQPFGYRDIYATPKEHLYFALAPEEIPIHQRHYDYQMEGRMRGNAFQRLHPWDVQPWPLSDIYALERFPMRLPPGSAEAEGIQQITAGKLTTSSLLDQIPTRAVSASMAQTARGGTKKGAKTGRTVAEPETNAGANTSAAANVNTSANANSNTNPNAGDNNTQARSERLASANPLGMELTTTPTTPEATTSHNILNLGHNTVPRVSLSVLTPSEVRQLQQDYRNLRRSVLYREERCPYFGCPAKFPRRELDRLQRHLHERHVVRRCNFCDAPERPSQSVGERMAHMREKHMEVFRAMVAEADGLDPGATRTQTAAASKAEKAKSAPKPNKRKRPQKKTEIEVVGPRVKRRRREESEEESEAEESSDLSSAPTSNHSRDSTGEFRPVSQRRGDGQPKPAKTAMPELAKPNKADKAPSEIITDSSDEESDVPGPGAGSLSMATRPRATPSQLAARPRTSPPGPQPQRPASRPAQPAPNPTAAATTTAAAAAAAGSGRRPKPKTTADKGIDLPNHSDTPSRSMPKLSHPHRKPPRPSPPAEWFQSSSPARSPTPSPAPAPARARTPAPAPAAAPAPAPVPVPKAVPVSNTTKATRTPVPTSRASPKPESPPKKAPATRRAPRRAAVTSAQKTAETLKTKPKPKPKAKGTAKGKKDDGK